MTAHKETILAECADYIRNNETEKLQLMFKLMDRVPDEGIAPMLDDLEAHIYANGIGMKLVCMKLDYLCFRLPLIIFFPQFRSLRPITSRCYIILF